MNFTNIIDKAIYDRIVNRESKPRDDHNYWPSEASIVLPDKLGNPFVHGKCMRACFYGIKQYKITNHMTPNQMRKIETGRIIEQQEHEYARDAGILVDHNIKKKKQYGTIWISSEIDALYKDDENDIIIDIKSYYGYLAKRDLEGNMRNIGRPKLDHVLQLMLYLDIFDNVPYSKLRYIDRGDMNIVEHRVELKPYRIKQGDQYIEDNIAVINGESDINISVSRIIQRYNQLDQYMKSDTLPPRDYRPVYSKDHIKYLDQLGKLSKTAKLRAKSGKSLCDWRCSYCTFRNQCQKDG